MGRGSATGGNYGGSTGGTTGVRGRGQVTGRDGRDDFTRSNWNGNVTVTRDDKADQIATNILGSRISDKDLAAIVGAPDGANVRLELMRSPSGKVDNKKVRIMTDHPWYETTQSRVLGKDTSGNILIKNVLFETKASAPKGIGARVMAHQIEGARKVGVTYLTADGAGNASELKAGKSKYNGFYTLARFGFNSKLDIDTKFDMPSSLRGKGINNTNDLMTKGGKEGADFWRNNGRSTNDAVFDLRKGSTSSQIFDAYKNERGIRI